MFSIHHLSRPGPLRLMGSLGKPLFPAPSAAAFVAQAELRAAVEDARAGLQAELRLLRSDLETRESFKLKALWTELKREADIREGAIMEIRDIACRGGEFNVSTGFEDNRMKDQFEYQEQWLEESFDRCAKELTGACQEVRREVQGHIEAAEVHRHTTLLRLEMIERHFQAGSHVPTDALEKLEGRLRCEMASEMARLRGEAARDCQEDARPRGAEYRDIGGMLSAEQEADLPLLGLGACGCFAVGIGCRPSFARRATLCLP